MPLSRFALCTWAAIMLASLTVARAEDYSDPSWPCVQRKVQSLSLGLMWPHPVPDDTLSPSLADPAHELVQTLLLRRVPEEQISALTTDFGATYPDLTIDKLGLIFRDAFTGINRERSQLIDGIGRYSLTQIDLATRIEDARLAFDAEMAKADPDFDHLDALEEQLAWDERIYRDRAQSLTYVCETPVLLEKRAYAIAQALGQLVPD
ncbi:hypothetical protein ACJ5NV_09295 [Loktanella agnita]|uniref:hypothetical protein n=1 Tax=Loktanella agnita TaxID=287097 RepID=UPI003987F632